MKKTGQGSWMGCVVCATLLLTACGGVKPGTNPGDLLSQPLQERNLNRECMAQEPPDRTGSLWRGGHGRGLFQDLRAHRVGDLVTINIVETAKASKKANTKGGRESSIDAGIDNLLGWEKSLGKFFGSDFDNASMFKASITNDFNGTGETSRDESMTASITARVVDVTSNGNLFIRGTREVRVNNENQYITLTGLVRPEDISPDNTVLSSYIADARISYTGSGSVSDKQRPGWLMRAADYVWPF